ncbi:MAG: carbohydrate-binding domain-containing protein [Lachnospiraceae bacterium]|nr:carbohydrate-binding domain-containing protein [Lachnospiraceae bacterium]
MEKYRKHIGMKLLAAGLAAALVLSTAACAGNNGFPSGEFPGEKPGEMPGGEMPGGNPGEMPGGEAPDGSAPEQGGWMRPGQNGGKCPGQNGNERPGQNGWGPNGNQSNEKESVEAPDLNEAGITIPESVTGAFTITTYDGTFTQDGNVWTITSAGTYVLSGVLDDGQVRIEANGEDTVELDLNNTAITCSFDSPILAESADKLKIRAMDGTENLVNDTRPLRTDENDEGGAGAIYACCDLSLNGEGSLTVIGTYNNAVHTKDDLKIKEMTLSAAAPNNALKGNDSVTVESGTLKLLSTGGDGIKTENDDVSEKGNQRGIITVEDGKIGIWAATDGFDASYDVLIKGGSIDVTAGDDGIHAEKTLQIDGGTVTVADSREGLEGFDVNVNGGVIHVFATDDAVNASGSGGMSNDGLITVTGGELYAEVTGRDVDGIDSNGSYKQTGGIVIVSNPYADASGNMSAVDVAGKVDVTGGTIIALGTVPGQGQKGGFGGFFGMGGMRGTSALPEGAVTFTGTLNAGVHSFCCGSVNASFTLRSAVSGGWIWSEGIASGNYTLN